MMSNIGSTLKDLGRDREAEEMLQNSLKIQLAILGPNDGSVAGTINRLAVLYDDNIGNFSLAEKHYLECIRIQEKLYGPGYSQNQFSYHGLIDVYSKTGDKTKRKVYQKKKEEWEKLQKKEKKKDKKEEGDEGFKWSLEKVVKFLTEEEKKEE